MAVERVIDLEHQRYADIPSTNDGVPGRGEEEQARLLRVRQAADRMRSRADGGDRLAQDVVILLGLDS